MLDAGGRPRQDANGRIQQVSRLKDAVRMLPWNHIEEEEVFCGDSDLLGSAHSGNFVVVTAVWSFS